MIVATRGAIASGTPVNSEIVAQLKESIRDIFYKTTSFNNYFYQKVYISIATSRTPEFAVVFDVDYVDTELGRRLAALAEAVRAGDRLGMATNSRVIINRVRRMERVSVYLP